MKALSLCLVLVWAVSCSKTRTETVPTELLSENAPPIEEPPIKTETAKRERPEDSLDGPSFFAGCTRRVYSRRKIEEISCGEFVLNVNRTSYGDYAAALDTLVEADSGGTIGTRADLEIDGRKYWSKHYSRRDKKLPRGYVLHTGGVQATPLSLACADSGRYESTSDSPCVAALKGVVRGQLPGAKGGAETLLGTKLVLGTACSRNGWGDIRCVDNTRLTWHLAHHASRLADHERKVAAWILELRGEGGIIDGPKEGACTLAGRATTCVDHVIRRPEQPTLRIRQAKTKDAEGHVFVVCSWFSDDETKLPMPCNQVFGK